MRMSVHQDRRRSSELNQQVQDTPDIAALRATGVQFAVAVCSRTAFTKTIIAFGVDDAIFIERGQIPASRTNILSAFQQHWPDTGFNESQGSKQPRGPRSDDHYLPSGCRHVGKRNMLGECFDERLANKGFQREEDMRLAASGIYRSA